MKGLCSLETHSQHLGASERPEAPAWGAQKGAESYVQNDKESSQLASKSLQPGWNSTAPSPALPGLG